MMDPVPRGEDAGLPALPRPPQAAPLRGHGAREPRRPARLCAAACPAHCIRRRRRREHARQPRAAASATPPFYEINLSRCIFAGHREAACPFDAITMGHDYELSDYNRSDLIFTKEQMLLAESVERTPLRVSFRRAGARRQHAARARPRRPSGPIARTSTV